jgi:predicted ABC-type ATPase
MAHETRPGNLRDVGRLIHLNGPPGIGKSTIASAFADRHPGVLNLDIDRVSAMIGGCGENFSDSFDAGRLLAAAMDCSPQMSSLRSTGAWNGPGPAIHETP